MTQREEDQQGTAEEEDDETEEEPKRPADSKRNTAGDSKRNETRHHILHGLNSKTRGQTHEGGMGAGGKTSHPLSENEGQNTQVRRPGDARPTQEQVYDRAGILFLP